MGLENSYGLFMFLPITAHNIIIQNNTIRILTLGAMQGKYDIFGMLSVELNYVAIFRQIYVYIKCGGSGEVRNKLDHFLAAIFWYDHELHVYPQQNPAHAVLLRKLKLKVQHRFAGFGHLLHGGVRICSSIGISETGLGIRYPLSVSETTHIELDR